MSSFHQQRLAADDLFNLVPQRSLPFSKRWVEMTVILTGDS